MEKDWEQEAKEIIEPYSDGLGEVVIHPEIQERIERCLRNFQQGKSSQS
tara:strand:+ start:1409 stop:1555 length:147 start_codon:yes stop_codon:yes gene_type:complete